MTVVNKSNRLLHLTGRFTCGIAILVSICALSGCGQNQQFSTINKSRQPMSGKRAEVVSTSITTKRAKNRPSAKNPAAPVTAQRDSFH